MPFKEKSVLSALKDICENIALAQKFVVGLSQRDFLNDKEKIYATIRCLEIISEASRKISPEIRNSHPEIEWSAIAAAGNIYRHEYEKLQDIEIWNTIQLDLPLLGKVVDEELRRMRAI